MKTNEGAYVKELVLKIGNFEFGSNVSAAEIGLKPVRRYIYGV